MTTSTTRLDKLLVREGLSDSREKARRMIMAGMVKIDGRVISKPGTPVTPGVAVHIRTPPRYVGRGGEKLEAALRGFGVEVRGARCLDIGASTGGFTDCLLQHGAKEVIALDVGRGQLAERLRSDHRVQVIESVNARYLQPSALPFAPGIIVIDVSFISLSMILPAARRVIAPGGRVIALVKPQFEAGRKEVRRGGVVRDPAVRARVLTEVSAAAVISGFSLRDTMESPLRGPAGNVEYFLHLRA